ncbi:MAG: L-seryl-tRNA(Sec) selenium transferase [Candidatus Marinimicrobia bacterium]|nr:L-seryl-tRNA(Sec) selenium transferase [Candidatus Neomarinimicrobiota bacterium]MBL7009775.1 L-seryl-tRNA(Sec) selenium transferase [Candidatus Neomarinimicrobiota bacterium]MBL7029821.1 L-seryl-tRNA(Sec) selenium transferase [Candidatus Neomarinimicrobiota bacterium]
MTQNQLKELPSVSEVLLESDPYKSLNSKYITYIIKAELDGFRRAAIKGTLKLKRAQITQNILSDIEGFMKPSMKSIINGTGIVLHTGLGRAPMKESVAKQVAKRVSGYTNLEFDLPTGTRGQRQNHVNGLLSALTGAQSTMAVNNNAAAVLLALNELGEGKEVIVSRGQQVEIGGSFRIPDVIKKSGCILKEVGSTNRTHIKDYEKAINKKTGIILWVHTSNYVVRGFTHDVGLSDLVQLGKKKRVPVVADLGSGALVDLSEKGVPKDMLVQDVVKSGVGLVTFSGDKLLGGPQAGLIVGKKTLVNKLKKNPIARAVRCDKWSLAFLEESLRSFGDDGPSKDNLTISLMTSSRKALTKRGETILSHLPKKTVDNLGITLVESDVEAGSGSLPEEKLDSMAFRFKPKGISASKLAAQFRTGDTAVVGYIHGNTFYIDLKAVIPGQEKDLAGAISAI